jgi:hypothetical protein
MKTTENIEENTTACPTQPAMQQHFSVAACNQKHRVVAGKEVGLEINGDGGVCANAMLSRQHRVDEVQR